MNAEWYLICKEGVDIIRKALEAPTHEATPENCNDFDTNSDDPNCPGCIGNHLRKHALHELDTGIHVTTAIPLDYQEFETLDIRKDFFEHLLNCLANQKYIGEAPPNGDALDMGQEAYEELHRCNQQIIDDAWSDGMAMLQEKDFVPKTKFLTE